MPAADPSLPSPDTAGDQGDVLKEACGVFAIFGQALPVAQLCYLGLFSLQHRGQEAAGMAGVENETPDILWMSAEELGRHAVEAAEQGKRAVVPGALNRAQSLVGQHTPRSLALPVIERVWRAATSRGTLER